MTVRLIHPWTGEIDYTYDYVGEPEVERVLQSAAQAAPGWAARSLDDRAGLMRAVAARLREQRDVIAAMMTADMGKLRREGLVEIEKSASACEYYADHAIDYLRDGMIAAAALDAGCTTLFSEDMQDGLLIERSLRIRNPFRVT